MFDGMKTWRVIDYGQVPENSTQTILFSCPKCDVEAELPVVGIALAQMGYAVVFDTGKYAMPRVIQCRYCRRQFESESK